MAKPKRSTKKTTPRDQRQVALTRRLVRQILTRDARTCVYCGMREESPTVDHVRPRSWFPPTATVERVNDPGNLVCACSVCNCGDKNALDLESYGRKLLLTGVAPRLVSALVERVITATNRPLPKV